VKGGATAFALAVCAVALIACGGGSNDQPGSQAEFDSAILQLNDSELVLSSRVAALKTATDHQALLKAKTDELQAAADLKAKVDALITAYHSLSSEDAAPNKARYAQALIKAKSTTAGITVGQ
jgi:hypothetical protein